MAVLIRVSSLGKFHILHQLHIYQRRLTQTQTLCLHMEMIILDYINTSWSLYWILPPVSLSWALYYTSLVLSACPFCSCCNLCVCVFFNPCPCFWLLIPAETTAAERVDADCVTLLKPLTEANETVNRSTANRRRVNDTVYSAGPHVVLHLCFHHKDSCFPWNICRCLSFLCLDTICLSHKLLITRLSVMASSLLSTYLGIKKRKKRQPVFLWGISSVY